MKKRIALIDGDELLYRAGFASQHVYYYVFDLEDESEDWKARFPYAKQAKEYCKDLPEYLTISCTEALSEKEAIEKLRREVRVVLHDI